jgi:hypothetical protein
MNTKNDASKKPCICPVCSGKGQLPHEFYRVEDVWSSTNTDISPIPCKSCSGKGYINQTMIYILCAAVHFKDGGKYNNQPININTGFVVVGRRHSDCFNTLSILTGENIHTSNYGKPMAGFITSDNRFVGRSIAAKIAAKAGQINKSVSLLISEDLY